MLETYFVKPTTVDRIRASWIGTEVERYADWLADEGYAAHCVRSRVPLLVAFGEFARHRGAKDIAELGFHIEAFVASALVDSAVQVRTGRRRGKCPRRFAAR